MSLKKNNLFEDESAWLENDSDEDTNKILNSSELDDFFNYLKNENEYSINENRTIAGLENSNTNSDLVNKSFSQKKIKDYNDVIYKKHIDKWNNLIYRPSIPNYEETVSSYVYEGVVDSCDRVNNKFSATLVNSEKESDKLNVQFDISDVSNPSERQLIDRGVSIFWIIGEEEQILTNENGLVRGTRRKISKILVRRGSGLNKKKLQKAKEKANEWSNFFKKLGLDNSTQK